MAEERLKTEIKDNVIVSMVDEVDGENLHDVLVNLVPDLAEHNFEAVRVGHQSTGENARPRLVRVHTTAAGKKLLMKKRDLHFHDKKLYVNHDLTPGERKLRKKLLPKFRELRQAGIACSFPKDKIVRNGKEMTERDIARALST